MTTAAVAAETVRVLLVEDNEHDATLIIEQLQRDGFTLEWRRVDCEADYLSLLDSDLDIILSDYRLPSFDVPTALRLLHERKLDIPFIVISGTIGEERAVEVLKLGADDYLLKDRLQRLGASVTRVMEKRLLQREFQRARAALEESERQYRVIFDNHPQPMWICDRETERFLDVNTAAIEQYGYSRAEFLGMAIADIDRLGALKHQRKDSSLIDVDVTSHDIDFNGRPARVVVSHDITERRRVEESLLANQQRTKFALSAGDIGIWDWDVKSGTVHWSETLERIHGLASFTFGGTMTAFLDCIHGEDRAAMQAEIDRALAERRDAVLQYKTVLPDGSARLIACRGRFFRNEAGDLVSAVGIGIDVSERRQLEAQLVQSQKMEAIGQLAGGVAHDFNNLLTAILGYAELLVPVVEADAIHRNDLEQIRKAAVRATRLTSQLLAFSRQQILQPVVVDLNVLVADVAALLGRLIGEDIRLTLRLEPELGRTKADPGQIEQVIVNLAINARDAMSSGGSLTIQTMNVDVDDHFFLRHGFVNESQTTRFVVLAVTDTGHGIDAVTRNRIFEPFFTTKPKGKGTGLGLATVYGIVKQSGGSIWVYSEPGQGATFKIYLPRTDKTVAAATTAPHASTRLGGTETILLVEDEEAVRMLTRVLLERHGYRVLVAADAEHAMIIAAAETEPIHLLVSDVVMPGLSGPELYAQLSPLRPEMRVLFLSGYADETIVNRGALKSGAPFMQKPFTATALSSKVRELLDGVSPLR